MTTPLRAVVVGGGIMGRSIAVALATAGHDVTVVESDATTAASLPDVVTVSNRLDDAARGAGLVIEAVPESMAIKTPVWTRLGELCAPTAILATNTSAFDIDAFADLVPHPERVLGTHWFNPATVVPCVEVVRGTATSEDVLASAVAILREAGKHPIVVRNSPGFVANRIQFALVREALLCLQEGLASAEDIDAIVSSSFGPRLAVLGPLANADLGGLDTYRSILTFLSSTLGDRFAVPAVLDELVEAGRLGTKTLAGISDYTPDSADLLARDRDSTLRKVLDATHRTTNNKKAS